MATTTCEPVLSRIERLDLMMSYLEEIKGSNTNISSKVKRNSGASATSTSTGGSITSTTDDGGGNSSVNSSPKSAEKQRGKPMEAVVVETRVKGSLIERVDHLEIRLLQLEEDIEKERKREVVVDESTDTKTKQERKRKQKGFKTLVKSCIKGNHMNKE